MTDSGTELLYITYLAKMKAGMGSADHYLLLDSTNL